MIEIRGGGIKCIPSIGVNMSKDGEVGEFSIWKRTREKYDLTGGEQYEGCDKLETHAGRINKVNYG